MQLAPTEKRLRARVRRVLRGFGRAKAVKMFGPEITARCESGSRGKPRRLLRGQVAGTPAHRRLARRLDEGCVLDAQVRAEKAREAGEVQP